MIHHITALPVVVLMTFKNLLKNFPVSMKLRFQTFDFLSSFDRMSRLAYLIYF